MSIQPKPLTFGLKINKFIKRFPTLQYDGTIIKCLVCETDLVGWNSSNCKRHIRSSKHVKNSKLQVPYWVFVYDLIFMLTVCNIPLVILNNEQFRLFWNKHVPKWPLPRREGLRRHLPRVIEETENYIRSDLSDKKLWITVDETTDRKNNKVGNVLVRILTPNRATMPYLLASRRLEENNAESIQHLVLQALEKFCINKNNILMLVTDEATYMNKAAISLKNFCPNLLHITCLLRALHYVAESIRNSYPNVDKLISDTGNVFEKSPQHVREFCKSCPGIPEPPQPILTKWGTWLKATSYYHNYFHEVKSVILKFDPKETKAIKVSQQQYKKQQIEIDLATIHENYSILSDAINQLQNSAISLAQSLEIVDNVNIALHNLADATGVKAAGKLNELLQKNPDFSELCHIKQCLTDGKCTSDLQQYFAYANVTSLDVERSFSNYSAIFTDKRTCLKESTLEGILMMQVYARAQRSLSPT